ncbi:MAG: beta-glucoside-specific PTS transporter subunit IIABC [Bacillota bacterium]|nr:beta-glucoside-specific PTS transporter subunit IIABC [Bacillota bacterium]
MDFKKCASDVVKYVGGEKNIVNLEHCSTRLRFTVGDKALVDQENLKKVPGVMKLIVNSQVQVVIGNNVVEVYDEIMKNYSIGGATVSASTTEKRKVSEIILEYLVGIFQPLIPVMAGAGILKSILVLLTTLGIMAKDSSLYSVLISISDATFYFMPMMVAYTTATKLKTNRMVAIAAVGVTLLPNMTTMLADGLSLFGIGLRAVAYNAQVFPAILCTLFLGMMEKWLNKISPKAIRTFFVPMVALTITVPVTLMFLGPLGITIGELLATFIMTLYAKFGFIAVALVAAILPLMVSTGMHKAMIPYVVSSLGTLGYEILYNAASLAHNLSECGACAAVALKSKDSETKQIASAASISALLGITEPALYGVTLQNQRVLKSVMLASGLVGAFEGFVGLKAFVAVGPGLASITMFVDPENAMNIVFAIIGLVGAIALGFIFTFLFWKEEGKVEVKEEKKVVVSEKSEKFYQPIEGKVIALEEVKDDMFAQKVLGDGIAIVPEKGVLVAPCDGTIKMVFETKHAIGMESTNGTELLFHVGMNTVELQGKYYDTKVKVGDTVKKGDVLLTFDLEAIQKEGYDCTTPMIVTNTADYAVNALVDSKDGCILTTERK